MRARTNGEIKQVWCRQIYTDEAAAYNGLPHREAVKHSTGEYVRGMAHVNGRGVLLVDAKARP